HARRRHAATSSRARGGGADLGRRALAHPAADHRPAGLAGDRRHLDLGPGACAARAFIRLDAAGTEQFGDPDAVMELLVGRRADAHRRRRLVAVARPRALPAALARPLAPRRARAVALMLRVEALTKHYAATGAAIGINGVSFRVERGEFFTLLGPSGCGK